MVKGKLVTMAEIAEFFGISEHTIKGWRSFPEPQSGGGRGKTRHWDSAAVTQFIVAKEVARQVEAEQPSDNDERNEEALSDFISSVNYQNYKDFYAARINRQKALLAEGKTIDLELVLQANMLIITAVRNEFQQLGSKMSPEIGHAAAAIVNDRIERILQRIALKGEELREQHLDGIETEEEADAKRVGKA